LAEMSSAIFEQLFTSSGNLKRCRSRFERIGTKSLFCKSTCFIYTIPTKTYLLL